jgi:hypothetical protein
MATDYSFLEVVDDRLEEYQEQWLRDHKVAQLCCEFEEQLAGFLELFRMVSAVNSAWRKDVFTNTKPFDAGIDAAIKSLYKKWLSVDSEIQDAIAFFEGQGYAEGVVGALRYKQYARSCRNVIDYWKAPEVSPAIGHHQIRLNKDQSEKFFALLGPKGLN